jgi:hypothetical protein
MKSAFIMDRVLTVFKVKMHKVFEPRVSVGADTICCSPSGFQPSSLDRALARYSIRSLDSCTEYDFPVMPSVKAG